MYSVSSVTAWENEINKKIACKHSAGPQYCLAVWFFFWSFLAGHALILHNHCYHASAVAVKRPIMRNPLEMLSWIEGRGGKTDHVGESLDISQEAEKFNHRQGRVWGLWWNKTRVGDGLRGEMKGLGWWKKTPQTEKNAQVLVDWPILII